MTQNYSYFKYDSLDSTSSGKTRGEIWHEESFQDYIANTGRDCQLKTVTDPVTQVESTKMVQVDSNDIIVTVRCASYIDHPVNDERCYLIEDSESTSSLFSLNNADYISSEKQNEYNFEIKTKDELEALGFIFDEDEG